MRILIVPIAAAIGLVLALLSFPFMLWAMGCGMLGDDDAADRAIGRSPLALWLDWALERRR